MRHPTWPLHAGLAAPLKLDAAPGVLIPRVGDAEAHLAAAAAAVAVAAHKELLQA